MAITPFNPERNISSFVFVDGSLANLQATLSGLDPSLTAIVLDPEQDGIRQMADALAGMSGLSWTGVIEANALNCNLAGMLAIIQRGNPSRG